VTSVACYETSPSFAELFGSSTTVSTLFRGGIGDEYSIVPREIYVLPLDTSLFRVEWGAYLGVQLLSGYEAQTRINIIQEFASTLIENTKDIDPIFAKIAKDSFWDLI